jgi:hypothetical protein
MIDPIETTLTAAQLFSQEPSADRVSFEPEEFEDSFDFPNGRYFIGDPCYALSSSEWAELISGPSGCIVDIEGAGRGIYFDHPWIADDEGMEYPADSGCIGVAPINNLTPGHLARLKQLGRIIDFDNGDPLPIDAEDAWYPAFSVMTTANGSLSLGWNWFIAEEDM